MARITCVKLNLVIILYTYEYIFCCVQSLSSVLDIGGCVVSCISISAHTLRPISSNCSFINKCINYSQYCLLFLSIKPLLFPNNFLLSLHITRFCNAKRINSLLQQGPGRKVFGTQTPLNLHIRQKYTPLITKVYLRLRVPNC